MSSLTTYHLKLNLKIIQIEENCKRKLLKNLECNRFDF